ncbi:MAG: 3-phosphoglycerate dehydrogenase [Lachnospiraceae bacterium]|nr:3-phosphoglycerate dehydrogenase [Lachnospiraceae bacterium]
MKVHCLNAISPKGTSLMEGYEFTDELKDADAVLVRSAKMHDMEIGDGLLSVARAGAGVNNIPLEAYAEKGIVVFNTPGANANAVKELIVAALLLTSRDIHGGMKWVEENAGDPDIAKTVEKAKKAFAGREIMGKTLGVVGLGAVGAMVAEAALSLGMKVIGYDPFLSVNAAWRISPACVKSDDLKKMAAQCDYVTIHVPATPSTNGMISAEIIGAMKPDAVLLNFSRDSLVDEEALTAALEEGKISRYISDFPNPVSVKMKNTLLVPHLGASTEEAEDNCAVKAALQTMDYLENGNIVNSVNVPAVSLGAKSGPRAVVLAAASDTLAAQVSEALAGCGISGMACQTRGANAAMLVDLAQAPDQAAVAKIEAIPGVYRVRVL